MMNQLKVYTLSFLLSVLTVTHTTRAIAAAPSLAQQLNQVANWFTGMLDNSQQVMGQTTVPLISITSCSVQLDSSNSLTDVKNIYFEQESSSFERLRLYSFSQGNTGVNLSIRSFLDNTFVRGLCNEPQSTRKIPTSNLPITSCDLNLIWQETDYYKGSNEPNGCPAGFGLRVVSNVTVWADRIDSLDQIFNAQGDLVVNTPIEFRRVYPIPEPSLMLGILAVGLWGSKKVIPSKFKHKSKKHSM